MMETYYSKKMGVVYSDDFDLTKNLGLNKISESPSMYHDYDGGNWVLNENKKEADAIAIMRGMRNLKLVETDWQATSDRTMTNEQQIYRQQLRDLPENSTPALDEDGQLTGVTWPEMPE
jgi:hypothetical protein